MPQYQGIWTLAQAAQLQSTQRWVTDPLFENTTLLLQADNAANGAQNNTFLDSSSNNFTITRNGNTTQGTFTPFSATGWSNNFVRASSQYLTVSNSSGDFSFGTGAFTIECWINPSSLPSGTGYPAGYWIFGGGPVNLDTGIDFYINNTQIGFNLTTFVTPTAIGNHGMSVGNWYHVAVVRGGGSNQTLSIYVNGTRVATASSVTATADAATTGIAISAAEPSGATSGNFDGYISNYRIVKGAAVYDPTSLTLTVPTTPLTAVSNTVLLTCQSNRFIDTNTQVTAKTITVTGTPSVQAFSPFAPQYQYTPSVTGGSGYFDGTGDTLSIANNAALNVGSGNFCIEAWFYLSSTTVSQIILSNAGAFGSDNTQIDTNSSSNIRFASSATVWLTSSGTPTINSWNHVAVSRSGTTLSMFVNGSRQATATNSTNFANANNYAFAVGAAPGYAAQLTGYVSNIRVVKGSSVYDPTQTTITLPTAPLTAVTNTQLLLNFTNAGIYDGTLKNNLETVGNAQVSTSVVKYGTGSMYFDGTGDALSIRPSPDLQLGSGDWTVEMWVYLNSTAVTQDFFSLWNGSSAGSSYAFLYDSNLLYFYWYTTVQTSVTVYWTPSTATWYHLAFSKSGTTLRFFVNGTQQGSNQTVSTTPATGTVPVYVGGLYSPARSMNGYIDDLRITKGIARYTANFTPPSVALPRQ